MQRRARGHTRARAPSVTRACGAGPALRALRGRGAGGWRRVLGGERARHGASGRLHLALRRAACRFAARVHNVAPCAATARRARPFRRRSRPHSAASLRRRLSAVRVRRPPSRALRAIANPVTNTLPRAASRKCRSGCAAWRCTPPCGRGRAISCQTSPHVRQDTANPRAPTSGESVFDNFTAGRMEQCVLAA
ncbi:hypothetical protein FGB62_8g413 [Gracilaria domingensis]|nr:hypothetical protein FGB62_8g413 [Gracilaria domingensis]